MDLYNINDTLAIPEFELTRAKVFGIINIVFSILGLIANFIVIFIILVLKDFKKITHWYALQLAIADTLFLLTQPFIGVQYLNLKWIFSIGFCKTVQSILFINYFASVLFLMIMSIDRYLAVCYSLSTTVQNFRKTKVAYVVSVLLWVIAVSLAVPIMLYTDVVGRDPHCLCRLDFPKESEQMKMCFKDFEELELLGLATEDDFAFCESLSMKCLSTSDLFSAGNSSMSYPNFNSSTSDLFSAGNSSMSYPNFNSSEFDEDFYDNYPMSFFGNYPISQDNLINNRSDEDPFYNSSMSNNNLTSLYPIDYFPMSQENLTNMSIPEVGEPFPRPHEMPNIQESEPNVNNFSNGSIFNSSMNEDLLGGSNNHFSQNYPFNPYHYGNNPVPPFNFDFDSFGQNDSDINREEISSHCTYHDSAEGWFIFLWVAFGAFFILPILVMTLCYGLIIYRLSQAPRGSTSSAKAEKDRRRVTFMCCILVVSFVCCWVIFYASHIGRILTIPNLTDEGCKVLGDIGLFFAYLNSALNPYLYTILGTGIKRKFQSVRSSSAIQQIFSMRSRIDTRMTSVSRPRKSDKSSTFVQSREKSSNNLSSTHDSSKQTGYRESSFKETA